MPPGRGRTYTPEQNALIRTAARELVKRYGSQPKLAVLLEIKQPSLSNYLLERHDAGPHFARKVAELKGMTLEELLGETRTLEPLDRYPNRAVAVGVARRDGLPEAAIQVVLSAELQSESDLPIIEWIDAIRDEVRRQRRFAGDAHAAAKVLKDAERATTPTAEEQEGALTRMHRLAAEAAAAHIPAAEPAAESAPRVVRRRSKH